MEVYSKMYCMVYCMVYFGVPRGKTPSSLHVMLLSPPPPLPPWDLLTQLDAKMHGYTLHPKP